MNRGGAVPDGEDILRRARLFLMGSPGNGQGTYLILFSLSMIVVPRQEVSRLRARPKGFPIALWKPSGPSS